MMSHHLDWIAREAKDVPPPRLKFIDCLIGCSGCYYRPQGAEIQIYDEFVSLDKGLILVSEAHMTERGDLPNTLAHEWRHHWQTFNAAGPNRVQPFRIDIAYQAVIIEFFQNPRERDALVFSHRKAPSETSGMWISWINKSRLLRKRNAV